MRKTKVTALPPKPEKPKQKIFRGMFRPRWEDIFNEIVTSWKKNQPEGNTDLPECALHRCQCGMLVQLHYLRDHWQQGHYDKPVYQDIEP